MAGPHLARLRRLLLQRTCWLAALVALVYPAQLEVGKEYAEKREPEMQAFGKKIIACAASASPAYK